MLTYLIEVSLCWFLFYGIYALWLSKETFFTTNRWYLISSLLLGVSLPLFHLEWTNTIDRPTVIPNFQSYSTEWSGYIQESTQITILESTNSFTFNWLAIVYWAGVIITLIVFILKHRQLIRLLLKGKKVKQGDYTLVIVENLHTPFSYFNWLFLNPKEGLSEIDQTTIFEHELAHIKEKHSIDILIIHLLQLLFWFNPILFFYKKSIKNIHEYLADRAVLKTTSVQRYGILLLQQSLPGVQFSLANHFFQPQIKNRIIMMTKKSSTPIKYHKYLVVLPMLLMNVWLFSFENTPLDVATFSENVTEHFNENLNTAALSVKNTTIKKDIEETTLVQTNILSQNNIPTLSECLKYSDNVEEQQNCTFSLLNSLMKDKMNYPANEPTRQGKIAVLTIVDEQGKVEAHPSQYMVCLVNGKFLNRPFIDEAKRIIGKLPRFIPAKANGKPIKAEYRIVIDFGKDGDRTVSLSYTSKPKTGIAPLKTSTIEKADTDVVLNVVDEMPRFIGKGCEAITNAKEREDCSDRALLEFVYSNITYPKEAQKAGTEGIVVVRFVVDKAGNIHSPKILRGLENGCNEVSIDVVKKMPKWIPGKDKGKNVSVNFNLPIRFQLVDKEEQEEGDNDNNEEGDNNDDSDDHHEKNGKEEDIDIKNMSTLKALNFEDAKFNGKQKMMVFNKFGDIVFEKEGYRNTKKEKENMLEEVKQKMEKAKKETFFYVMSYNNTKKSKKSGYLEVFKN